MDKPAILSNPEAFVVVPVEPIAYLQNVHVTDNGGRTFRKFRLVGEEAPYAMPVYARPDPTALADIVAYCAALEARLAEAERVIEPFADPSSGTTEGSEDGHCDVSVSNGELRALRAWKENGNG